MKVNNWNKYHDFKKITVSKLISKSKFNINPLDPCEFLTSDGYLQNKKLDIWKEKVAFSTGFYHVYDIDGLKVKNAACGGYFNTFELAYVINYPKLEIEYLGEEMFT